jgi:hypothetical protein
MIIWNHYIGEDIIKHKCLCCKKVTISNTNFEVGHVIVADSVDGGGTVGTVTIDNTGTNRLNFFSGLTLGNFLISFTSAGDNSIYSGNSTSFIFDNGNTDISYNPFLEPNNLVLIQSSTQDFVIGNEVQINFTGI